MRLRTADRALVVIVVAMAAAALLAVVGGDPAARELVGGAVFLALLVGGTIWLRNRYRVGPRRASFADQVARAGLEPREGDPLRLLDSAYALFQRRSSVRDVENTATGLRDGLETVVADFWLAPSSDPSRDDQQRFVAVLTPVPSWWPDVLVVPERVASWLRSTLVAPDVAVELEGFNRRFEVRTTQARFAHALLDARMIEWLMSQPLDVGFEVREGTLLVFRRRATSSLDDVPTALATSDALRERIPRVVLGDPF